MTGKRQKTQPTPRVAAFRPADGRASTAEQLLRSLGADPVIDPMVALEATDERPRSDAAIVILTSPRAASLLEEWRPAPGQQVCAIGDTTAAALADIGIEVAIIPDDFSSQGLVSTLAGRVDGLRVEIARSDHGSNVLIEGLIDAGAYVHETVLYRLVRPSDAGVSVEQTKAGNLDAVLFTSPLTVEHFLEKAREMGDESAVKQALDEMLIGVIGDPTANRVRQHGLTVDLVADRADFERLAVQALAQL